MEETYEVCKTCNNCCTDNEIKNIAKGTTVKEHVRNKSVVCKKCGCNPYL